MRAKSFGQSALLLLDVIDILKALKIPYAVIGAMAASYYGVVRASMDADVVISLARSPVTVGRLKQRIEKAKLKVMVRRADADDPLRGLVMVEDAFGNQVDLILGIKGMDTGAYKRLQTAEFQGAEVRMIGCEDLVAMKAFAGKPKDMMDAAGILAVSGQTLDRPLLRRLTQKYGERALDRLNLLL